MLCGVNFGKNFVARVVGVNAFLQRRTGEKRALSAILQSAPECAKANGAFGAEFMRRSIVGAASVTNQVVRRELLLRSGKFFNQLFFECSIPSPRVFKKRTFAAVKAAARKMNRFHNQNSLKFSVFVPERTTFRYAFIIHIRAENAIAEKDVRVFIQGMRAWQLKRLTMSAERI